MRFTRLKQTYLVRMDTGEEIVGAISAFAADQRVHAATVSGIGSVYDVVLGYFNRHTRQYSRRAFDADMELVSLSGTIALKEGRPIAHLHAALGGREFQAVAGHLFEAKTSATCEVVIGPLEGQLQRVKDDATGLFLLDL